MQDSTAANGVVSKKPSTQLRCSFCNKEHNDVRKLIAGPTANICDECVSVCAEIIADESRFAKPDGPMEGVDPSIPPARDSIATITCALCGLPMLVDEGLVIQNRGILCAGCVGEVEAAIAERGSRSE